MPFYGLGLFSAQKSVCGIRGDGGSSRHRSPQSPEHSQARTSPPSPSSMERLTLRLKNMSFLCLLHHPRRVFLSPVIFIPPCARYATLGEILQLELYFVKLSVSYSHYPEQIASRFNGASISACAIHAG